MTNPQFAGHPFGTTVTAETLRNTFAPLTQWEDKYRQLIMLETASGFARGVKSAG